MKFIIKLFPEIIIKSQSIRLHFIKLLTWNIRNVFKYYDIQLSVIRHWDYIEIYSKKENYIETIRNILTCIPGIHHILEVNDALFSSLHNIFEKTLIQYQDKIEGKTFCVRTKRHGKHTFTSTEVERYVGARLNQCVQSAHVKLVNPDVVVPLEIKDNRLFLIKNRHEGIGGFPIGSQENVFSLISGGFDSGVSSYMLIRRGYRVHYCLFNIGGITHEISVQKIAYYLWNRFSCSHCVRFVSINFEPVIGMILEKINDGQMSVILKRMMVRAASRIARQYGVQALVTGEALGQVSSQTLTNLRLIDNVSDALILRPLISYDKEDIIRLARKIGIEELVQTTPEYCGMFSKHSTVKAIREQIEEKEKKLDFDILDKVVQESINMDIREITQNIRKEINEAEIVTNFRSQDVILDIRPIDEQEKKPLKVTGIKVISIPFYNLSTKFSKLDQNRTYLLWCDKGIMSRLQAMHLREKGFNNIKVYIPTR